MRAGWPVLLVVVGCGPGVPEGPRASLGVDPDLRAGRLDERYLGFAFDTAQFTGGMWWRAGSEERQPAVLPDLEDPRLRSLTAQLAPSRMRIGGTDCDAAYFCPEPGECELPEAYRDTFVDDDRLETVFTHDDLARAGEFAAAVGSEVLFCVNVGPGPRDPESGAWTPDDARVLLRTAHSLPTADVFATWEPGNEVNVSFLNFDSPAYVDAELFAGDLLRFRELVDEEAPGALVAAPGSYVSPVGEIQGFTAELMAELEALEAEPLDVLSWHLYATQSDSCPVVVDPATPEGLLDSGLAEQSAGFAEDVREAAAGLPVWNTESASAQCGGQQGLSDTQADAVWTADWLGLMAAHGTEAVIRHSLVGADYSLLDPDDFTPRPTFLVLVGYRQTVAGARLATEADRRVLAHGWCAPDGGVTAVVANPGEDQLVAEIDLGDARARRARQWTVEGDQGLASTRATVNGVAAGDQVPWGDGLEVAVSGGRAFPVVPAGAVVFARIELDREAAGCQQR